MTRFVMPDALLTTADAAMTAGLSVSTLRQWSCYEIGELRPVKLPNGRLGWQRSEVEKLAQTMKLRRQFMRDGSK